MEKHVTVLMTGMRKISIHKAILERGLLILIKLKMIPPKHVHSDFKFTSSFHMDLVDPLKTEQMSPSAFYKEENKRKMDDFLKRPHVASLGLELGSSSSS